MILKVIKLIILVIVAAGLIYCEQPSEFNRDNPNDPYIEKLGIEFVQPSGNMVISGTYQIIIESTNESTAYNLKSISLYLNDSLLARSSVLPLTYDLNTSNLDNGSYILKFVAKDNKGNVLNEQYTIYTSLNNPLQEIAINSDELTLNWDFDFPCEQYLIYKARSINMKNPQLLQVIQNAATHEYTTADRDFGKIYYQVIAVTENDSISSNIQNIEGKIEYASDIWSGGTYNIVQDSSGTIFATISGSEKGLVAYTYSNALQEIAYSTYEFRDVAVNSAGTLFCISNSIASGYIHVLDYNGSSFSEIAHHTTDTRSVKLKVISDDKVLTANFADGLYAYELDGTSFSEIGHIDDGGTAYDIATGNDGTIFLANGDDGLRAYTMDQSSLINTAHAGVSGSAEIITVADNGTVFLVADSLYAFSYDGSSLKELAKTGILSPYAMTVGFKKTVFVAGYAGFETYFFNGSSFFKTGTFNESNGQDIIVNNNGMIFLSRENKGLYAYKHYWSSE